MRDATGGCTAGGLATALDHLPQHTYDLGSVLEVFVAHAFLGIVNIRDGVFSDAAAGGRVLEAVVKVGSVFQFHGETQRV